MIKRIVAFLMASLLAVSMITGCGGEDNRSRSERTHSRERNVESETDDMAEADESEEIYIEDAGADESEETYIEDAEDIIVFDATSLDEFIEKYRSFEIDEGIYDFKLLNMFNTDWSQPELFVAQSADYFTQKNNNIRRFDIFTCQFDDQHEFTNITAQADVAVANKDGGGSIYADHYRIEYQKGGNSFCIYSSTSYAGETLSSIYVYEINYSSYLREYELTNKLGARKYMNINYIQGLYNINYLGLGESYYGEREYNNTHDYYTQGFNSSFSDSETYDTLDAAYEAYLNELVIMLYGSDANVEIVHASVSSDYDDEVFDDEVYLKYRDYFDSNDGSYGDGCMFMDIDGDGTPECIIGFGWQFQVLLYINQEGEVGMVQGFMEVKEGEGMFAKAVNDWGTPSYCRLENGCITEEYAIWGDTLTNDIFFDVFYYRHNGITEEITEEEYDALYQKDYISSWDLQQNDGRYRTDLRSAWQAYIN